MDKPDWMDQPPPGKKPTKDAEAVRVIVSGCLIVIVLMTTLWLVIMIGRSIAG